MDQTLKSSSNTAQEQQAKPTHFDLDAPEWYLNRELTWLAYNRRVLAQAADSRVPLLERVKFLAISGSNLDEFIMKRIGGLKQQLAAGVNHAGADGLTPEQQIKESLKIIRSLQRDQDIIRLQLVDELSNHGIQLPTYAELSDQQRVWIRKNYIDNIFPLVTPLAMDPSHPFPFISNLAMNLLVTLRFPGDSEVRMARVKVPLNKGVSPRFLQVDHGHVYVRLEDVMANNLDLLFPGMHIDSCELFRVTRNANVDIGEETADDLLESIETELRERHFAPIVRLEIAGGMDDLHRGMLAAELGLDEEADVATFNGMLGLRDMMELVGLPFKELRDSQHHPIDNPRLALGPKNIFHNIREGGPILLQHPYESFTTSVERFLRAAAADSKVMAIKMTLYRTNARGTIIDLLLKAAKNGKQVAVLVELKASFDEAANIGWARRLERAGIHVTYGVEGLKTHCKVILVVRKDYNGIRRYAHIGTGNYHSDTARLYSDLGMLTCNEAIGQDLTELFNYLTGYSPPPSYRKLLVAPDTLKRSILRMIDREIAHHEAGQKAAIQFKTNALEDVDIVRALYRASMAGVKVDLIVRDSCRIRPGITGLSENITVVSILGRFLEHSRIYYFRNAGQGEFYIGSADLMRRNLMGRVEVLTPVEDPALQEDLRLILDIQLGDQRNAWEMLPNNVYMQRLPEQATEGRGCQEMLIDMAGTRLAAAGKHQQKKVRRKLVNHFKKRLRRSEGI